jgi:hypothetical protein
MVLDVEHLRRPALIVHAEGLVATMARNLVEAGFREHEERAARDCFQLEFDEGRLLVRIVHLGIDRVGAPGEREQALGLHFLHGRLPDHVLIAGMGDAAARDLARLERALELDPKPFAELPVIRQSPPDAGDGGLQFDAFFDAITHRQPPGCRSVWLG